MVRMKTRITLLLLAFSASAVPAVPAFAQAAPAPRTASESLEQILDPIAADLIAKKEIAGFAIGVAERGRVRLIKGYGYANLEDHAPVTGRTVFRIGSISKEFTAATVLLLAEQGRLSLDDRLNTYFPSLPRGGEVTLRQLLNHTSGIHNYTALPSYRYIDSRRSFTSAEMLAHISGMTPLYDFDPGTKWYYSNSGYVLLGLVIEKVTGQPLAQVLRTSLFDPLGLNDTRFDDLDEIVAQRAHGYYKAPNSPAGFSNEAFVAMEVVGGAGAIRSTAADLLKWHEALLGGKVLKPASLALMTRPGRLKDGRLASAERFGADSGPPSDYGFGIRMRQEQGRRTIGHNGAINGFNASLTTYPDQQVTIVVLANTRSAAAAVTSAMVDSIFLAIGTHTANAGDGQ